MIQFLIGALVGALAAFAMFAFFAVVAEEPAQK